MAELTHECRCMGCDPRLIVPRQPKNDHHYAVGRHWQGVEPYEIADASVVIPPIGVVKVTRCYAAIAGDVQHGIVWAYTHEPHVCRNPTHTDGALERLPCAYELHGHAVIVRFKDGTQDIGDGRQRYT